MTIGKRVKMEKGKEKELVDSKEEVRGGRRRSRRIAKTNAKRRLKITAS